MNIRLTLIGGLIVVLLIFSVGTWTLFNSKSKTEVYVHTTTEVFPWQEYAKPEFYWVSNSINIDDVVRYSTGREIGKVVSVENIDWGGQRRTARLILKINTLFDKRTQQYKLGDRALQIGSTVKFTINQTLYNGTITELSQNSASTKLTTKKLLITIKAPEVDPWVADTYNSDFVVKNTFGNEIFRIINVDSQLAESSEPNFAGQLVKTYDPLKRDVFIKAIVEVECQFDVCMYNQTLPIKVGLTFWTQSINSIIEGGARIIEFEEFQE